MAYFYSLRGWLEVEPENFERLISVVKSIQASYSPDTKLGLYVQGWCWQKKTINWTQYLFYGADVTEEGLDFFKEMLDKLIAIGLNLSGHFHAQGEDGEQNRLYQITDDALKIEIAEPLIVLT